MSDDLRMTILIPTWNNLAYLRLCYMSLQKNSHFRHQIIVHVNEGSDGTKGWVEDNNIEHTYSEINRGICWAVNQAAAKAKTELICFMNDDMYLCPDWDLYLLNEIEAVGHKSFYISSTMIEPTQTNNPCVIFSKDFGDRIENFDEKRLLETYERFEKLDWSGGTWPPSVVHKDFWDLVGGYSIEFSPGMYSDPDFSMKLWQAGVRLFKGVSKSRVFHFQCKTTGKVEKNDGRRQFLRKWGISGSRFMKNYLRRGEPFTGSLEAPSSSLSSRLGILGDRLRSW